MTRKMATYIGWFGAAIILFAYALNIFSVVSARSVWYALFNFVGAVAIVVDAVRDRDYPPAALNFMWAVIAVVALVRIMI